MGDAGVGKSRLLYDFDAWLLSLPDLFWWFRGRATPSSQRGVNSLLRSSAAQIPEAELARFNLYRPFDPSGDPNNSEVNHIQLIPSGGPLSLAQPIRPRQALYSNMV